MFRRSTSTHTVLPGVQVHDQVLGLGVAVPDLALVAVWVSAHLGHLEAHVGRLVASLCGHRHLASPSLVVGGVPGA